MLATTTTATSTTANQYAICSSIVVIDLIAYLLYSPKDIQF